VLLTPEQKLWRAVLEQAYLDAELLSPDPDMSRTEHLRARSFLQGEDPEDALILALVCDFAEVPADRVVVWARRRYRLEL
jgi:hypothetical protein